MDLHAVQFPLHDMNELNAPASVLIEIGDLLYYDAAVDLVKPFSSLAPGATEAADQTLIAPLFVGVANSARLLSDASVGPVRFLTDRIFEYPVVSSAFDVGALVTATRDGGAGLVDQKLKLVTGAANAFGVVLKLYAGAVTVARVRLQSKLLRPPA